MKHLQAAFMVAIFLLIVGVAVGGTRLTETNACQQPVSEILANQDFAFKRLPRDQADVIDGLATDATGHDMTGDTVTLAVPKADDSQTILVFSKNGCFQGAIPMATQDLASILGQSV